MNDFTFGLVIGSMITCLVWWVHDRIKEYLILKYPDSPYWFHNRLKDIQFKSKGNHDN